MSNENKVRTIIPSVENNRVVLTIPAGDAEYPEGKVYRFNSFTPTDMIQQPDGEVYFPNNDGITAAALLAMSPEQIVSMAARFEEAVKYIDDLVKKREQVLSLLKSLLPDSFQGSLNLQFTASGMNINQGELVVPTTATIRVKGFAYEGVVYQSNSGKFAKYVLDLDENGKLNYTAEGIRYKRVT